MAVEMQSVKSSLIAGVWYDPENEELKIKFNSGGIYTYKKVPQGVFAALMAAPSIGKFFMANIRENPAYECIKPPTQGVFPKGIESQEKMGNL